jgi:RHS repeat-associated protein
MTYDKGKNPERFIWGNELISFGQIVRSKVNNPIYQLHDELRSPIRLISEDGQKTLSRFEYDEFGVLAEKEFNQAHEVDSTIFGYTGYQKDPISDLYYAQSRYYMPKVGRFISEDSYWNTENMIYGAGGRATPNMASIMQSSNLYAYCTNNPLKYIDLRGENAEEEEPHPRSIRYRYFTYDRDAAVAYA